MTLTRKWKFTVVLCISFFLSVIVFSKPSTVYGGTDDGSNGDTDRTDYLGSAVIPCDAEKDLFEDIKEVIKSVDIRRTAMNHIASTVFDGVPYAMVGKNNSDIQRCGVYFLETNGQQVQKAAECNATATDCADMTLVYEPGNNFAKTRTAGTLLGAVNFLQGVSENEPLPVNMAYWWNDNVARVPFAGKALAAPVTYSGPFLDAILGIWKFTRNVAYGIMSIVLLVVGFMIITRKKIGTQVAVTAQLAIPRIIIALILITFSYPIGALAASAGFVLQGNVESVIQGIVSQTSPLATGAAMQAGALISILVTIILALTGSGPVIMFILLAVVVVALFLWVAAWLKFATIYIKLLFSIIGAPIIFAFGAIPGNEAVTSKWFKTLAAAVISLPAIKFIIQLSGALTWYIAATSVNNIITFTGGLLIVFILPLVLIYGLNFARRVPDMIENWIVGDDTKKRR